MKNVITILTTTNLLFGVIQIHGSGLPNCGSGYRHNFFDTITFASGEKYVGEFKDDKHHGQGTVAFASGSIYVGEFREDEIHG